MPGDEPGPAEDNSRLSTFSETRPWRPASLRRPAPPSLYGRRADEAPAKNLAR